LWQAIERFAQYGFVEAHAVSYSIISFQSMWLKVHYPGEFYAASMSVLDSDKTLGIAKDAREEGIEILPPDINISTNIFEPRQEEGRWVLYTPFNRLKGLSDKTGEEIIRARNAVGGQFQSCDQFLRSVEARRCNARHVQILNDVGAFASIDPTAAPMLHIARRKAQIELMPGLVIDTMMTTRVMPRDKNIQSELKGAVHDRIFGCADPADQLKWLTQPCGRCSLAGSPHVPPRHGAKAMVMVVSDCPTWGEEDRGKMAEGLGSEYLRTALERNGLSVSDCYFTTLVKSRKAKGGRLTNEAITACSGYLDKEIELLRPQLIVTCGTSATRHILKGYKGNQESAGHAEFVSSLDATVVVGINPQSVYIDSGKQALLDKAFAVVAASLGKTHGA
jgi:DNA polymerase-3 subunit alpha